MLEMKKNIMENDTPFDTENAFDFFELALGVLIAYDVICRHQKKSGDLNWGRGLYKALLNKPGPANCNSLLEKRYKWMLGWIAIDKDTAKTFWGQVKTQKLKVAAPKDISKIFKLGETDMKKMFKEKKFKNGDGFFRIDKILKNWWKTIQPEINYE